MKRFLLIFIFCSSFIYAQDIQIPRGAEMEKIIDQLSAQGLFSKADAARAKKEMKQMDSKKWDGIQKQANQQIQQLMKSGAIDKLQKDPSQMESILKQIDPNLKNNPNALKEIQKKFGNIHSLPDQKKLMEMLQKTK